MNIFDDETIANSKGTKTRRHDAAEALLQIDAAPPPTSPIVNERHPITPITKEASPRKRSHDDMTDDSDVERKPM